MPRQATRNKARPSSVMASFSFRLPDRVAQVSYRVDKRRRVNLLAQTTNEGFNQFDTVLVFPFPDALAQFGAAKDAARFAHQHAQQGEFSCRKLDPARAAIQYSVGTVQNQIADLKLDERFLGKTSPERTHSRDQFLHRERLREVIIRAEAEAGHPIAYLA